MLSLEVELHMSCLVYSPPFLPPSASFCTKMCEYADTQPRCLSFLRMLCLYIPYLSSSYGPAPAPQTEDCLNLDVHTHVSGVAGDAHQNAPPKLLPVVVWLYGGSLIAGSTGSYVDGAHYPTGSLANSQPARTRIGPTIPHRHFS